jgi:hypothetical protein
MRNIADLKSLDVNSGIRRRRRAECSEVGREDVFASRKQYETLASKVQIHVNVTSDLRLDFGSATECERDGQAGYFLCPPSRTPYDQLIEYLDSKPELGPTWRTGRELEALAATALTIRWGSYYAVLADLKHQTWRHDGSIDVPSISDPEMARINIEASDAMARWINLYLSDQFRERCLAIARRAVAYLPIHKKVEPIRGSFVRVSASDARRLIENAGAGHREILLEAAHRAPLRILANAIITAAYRNGPIETVHGGRGVGIASDTPRLTPTVDRRIQSVAHGYMKAAHDLLWELEADHDYPNWDERAAPYWFVAPRWSTTETSREVFLPFGGNHIEHPRADT